MNIATERLQIREVMSGDADYVHELHSMPETDRYNTLGIPADKGETLKMMGEWREATEQRPQVKWVLLIENLDRVFIGLAGINMARQKYQSAEIWYKMHPAQWNKGYATEVLKGIVSYCFDTLQLHRVEAGCATDNVASARVMEKNGMTREGMKRKILPIRGEWYDGYTYAILEDDPRK